MAINYEPFKWDPTKKFNPSNMNHMDNGIKAACDKADANEKVIDELNSNLTINKIEVSVGEHYSGFAKCHRINSIVQVTLELTPTSINHGDIFLSGLPVPVADNYFSVNKVNGTVLPLLIQRDGTAIVYYPSDTSVARIDATFMYIAI